MAFNQVPSVQQVQLPSEGVSHLVLGLPAQCFATELLLSQTSLQYVLFPECLWETVPGPPHLHTIARGWWGRCRPVSDNLAT